MLTTVSRPDSGSDVSAAADLLRLAIGRANRRLRQQAGDELTASQASVLGSVRRHGPVTPSALADFEAMSKPAVTRMIRKLHGRGLLVCTPDPADRRSYTVTMSKDGGTLRRLRNQRKRAYLARLLSTAAPEEIDVLVRSAEIMLRLLEEDAKA